MGNILFNATEMRYTTGPCLNSSYSQALANAGTVGNYLYIFAYCNWSPIITMMGIVGNLFSIFILKKQFAKEQMYYFQLIIMIVEVLASLGLFLNGLFFPFLLYSTAGPNWVKYSLFLSNYVCIQTVLNNMLLTTLVLLVTVTNVDRLQAIISPTVYTTVNQKKRTIIVSILCAIVGIVTSLHDTNQRIVVYCPETNSYEVAGPKTVATIQTVLEYVRVSVRALSLLLLTVLTLVVGIKYRQIEMRKKVMTHNNNGGKAEQQLKSSHLLILQIVQSVTMFLTYFPTLYFYLNVYILTPAGLDTLGKSATLYTQIGNAIARLGPGVNFIFYVALSKKFRSAAKRLFSKGSVVTPTTINIRGTSVANTTRK